jgi:S1-C subfamily serine protease
MQSVRIDVERGLPLDVLERLAATHPLVFRGSTPRGATIYRERVNGVVLLASTNTVATGVLVSDQGDIVTNEHVLRAAHRARGGEWVAVWFKPSAGTRPAKADFLLARVLQRDMRRDLAHIRLAQGVPSRATAVPLAISVPDVGQDVFTIGHPQTYLWSFGHGVVAQVRSDYQWQYGDGIRRSATAIQTQAVATAGSSGSPLLNDAGAVVGIVVGAVTEAHGIYFAVAVEHVRELLAR